MTPSKVWVPSGYEIPAHRRNADALKLLLDKIIVGQRRWRDGWVHIPQEAGIELTGGRRSWDRARGESIDEGIVECDGIYKYRTSERKALGYRLTSEWSGKGAMQVELCDPRSIDRLAKLQADAEAVLLPVHHHMNSILPRITIDREGALKRARAIRCPERRRYAVQAVEKIAAGDIRLHPSPRTGRVFTDLTRLNRVLRPYLKLDGYGLAGFDISACQPYLFGLIAANHTHPTTQTPPRQERSQASQGQGERRTNTWRAFGGWSHDCMLPDDILRHLHGCETGTYYPEFAEVMCKPGSRPLTIRQAKDGWLKFVFGRHRPGSVWFRRFAASCPTMADVLAEMKAGPETVARILQTAEASLMIHGVCETIRVRFPEIPFFPIHDCVMTTEANVAAVLDINSEVWRSINACPNVKRVAY